MTEIKGPKITERQLQEAIIELAQYCGWSCYHTYDSRRSAAGFPDLVLARRGKVIFAELKSESGKLSPAQAEWLIALDPKRDPLEFTNLGVFVWWPKDWIDGTIEKILK